MRACGLNPVASTDQPIAPITTVSVAEIAARALRLCGINPQGPITGYVPANTEPTVTQTTIATEVLLKLEIYDPSESPVATDLAEVMGVVSQVHEVLTRMGLATWALTTIPLRAEIPYVQMAATLAASTFGRTADQSLYNAGLLNLWQQEMAGVGGQTIAQNAVLAVHDRLAALGYVDWLNSAIPQSVADSYVPMAAASLLPAYLAPAQGGTAYVPSAQADAASAGARLQLITQVETAAAAALETIRTIALSGSYGAAIALSKLGSVHDEMSALGLVSWPLSAVPAAQAEEYVTLASVLLWPDVEKGRDAQSRQVDQAAWDGAMKRMRDAAKIAGATALAQSRIATAHAELSGNNLVTWGLENIPDGVADAYVQMAVNSMQPSFDGKFDPAAYVAAIKRVRMFAMAGQAGQTLAQQKIIAVHAYLDARGKTRWSLFDVPDFIEEPYVLMAAFLLAPEVDVKPDPDWWSGGERMINQTIAMPLRDAPTVACYF